MLSKVSAIHSYIPVALCSVRLFVILSESVFVSFAVFASRPAKTSEARNKIHAIIKGSFTSNTSQRKTIKHVCRLRRCLVQVHLTTTLGKVIEDP